MSVGLIFGIVGILLLAIAAFFFMRTRTFIGRAKEAKGTVIQMEYRRNSSSSSGAYAAVYQFKTSDGQTIIKQDTLASNPPRFKVGQVLDVLYEPDNPNRATINTWMSLYFLPALLAALGVVSVVVALVTSLT